MGAAELRDYYEELWRRLPEDAVPHDFARRREFLLARVAPGERVLDLGAGQGDFAAALAEHGARPLAVEVAEAAVERARRRHPRLDVRLAPLGGPLPLPDNAFDVVWAGEVLEHVADTAPFLSEVRRVLTPGGRLLLSTPDHGPLRRAALALRGFEAHFDPLGDHLRFYTRRSLQATLVDLGFEVLELRRARGTLLLAARRARAVAIGRRIGDDRSR